MALLNIKEVATLLRVSQATIYRLIESKELDAIRVGRLIRIDPTQLASYLREQS